MSIVHCGMALLANLLWGVNAVVIKLGLQELSATTFNLLRFALFLPLLFFFKRPVAFQKLILLSLLLNVVNFTCTGLALERGGGAGLVIVIFQSSIFFTIFASFLINGDRPRKKELTGISIAFIGVFLLLNSKLGMGHIDLLSIFIMLLGSCANGFGFAYLRKYNIKASVPFAVWLGGMTFPPMTAIAFFDNPHMHVLSTFTNLSLATWLEVAFASFAAGIIAVSLWARLLREHKPSTLGGFTLLISPIALISSVLLTDETFTTPQLLAITLCLFGLFISQSGHVIVSLLSRFSNSKFKSISKSIGP